jgi:hypothetical protein
MAHDLVYLIVENLIILFEPEALLEQLLYFLIIGSERIYFFDDILKNDHSFFFIVIRLHFTSFNFSLFFYLFLRRFSRRRSAAFSFISFESHLSDELSSTPHFDY